MSTQTPGTTNTDRRGGDRRRADAPTYTGPERRKGTRRQAEDTAERLP